VFFYNRVCLLNIELSLDGAGLSRVALQPVSQPIQNIFQNLINREILFRESQQLISGFIIAKSKGSISYFQSLQLFLSVFILKRAIFSLIEARGILPQAYS
jgi:hypothetical protein